MKLCVLERGKAVAQPGWTHHHQHAICLRHATQLHIIHHHYALVVNAGTDLLLLFLVFPVFSMRNVLPEHQGISVNDPMSTRTARDVVSWVTHVLP